MIQSPETVYKYRSWSDENGKRILTEFELYLASPKDFNDPFDCRIPLNYKCLSDSEIEDYANYIAIKHSTDTIDHNKILHCLKNDIDAFQEMHELTEFEAYNNHYGVLSMSTEWNNILMWSHYGDKHQGICVGFKEKGLFETGNFGTSGAVKYPINREYPIIHPLKGKEIERHLEVVLSKSVDWLYENEYRLTKIFLPPNVPSKEERRVKFDPNLISEVTLGLNIDSTSREQIINICNQNNISVYEAYKVEAKFQIDRKKI
jgi:hypothetical protein